MANIIVVAPSTSTTNTLVNYNHTSIFDIRALLEQKIPSLNNTFSVITSENFLSQADSTGKICALTDQQLSQADAELQTCAKDYTNGLFLSNALIETDHDGFLGRFSSDLDKWSKLSQGALYPYLTDANLGPDSLKTFKIRNTSSNFSYIQNYKDFEYNVSAGYLYSKTQTRLKAMRVGNYGREYHDVLNLRLLDENYKNHVFIENLGPYYANGYPDLLVDFGSSQFFLLIGHDALNFWDMSQLILFRTLDLSDKPLIIQCDSLFADPLYGQVNPHRFFTSLFNEANVTFNTQLEVNKDPDPYLLSIPYPSSITVKVEAQNEEGSVSSLSPQQKNILTFLTQIPYILFADTQGYTLSGKPTTAGGVYVCDPQQVVSNQYIFTRRDDFITSQGTLGTGAHPGIYTQYLIPGND